MTWRVFFLPTKQNTELISFNYFSFALLPSSKPRHMEISLQCKAYLAAIIVWLYAEDVVEANSTYQDLMGIDAFLESEEGAAAENLLRAYSTGDSEQVKSLVEKGQVYRHIDTAVARLAKKLPVGNVTDMAEKLNGGAISQIDVDDDVGKEELDDDDLC